jgi:Sugar (and other) transporter
LGSHYWIIFAVLNATFVPVVYFFFPETTNRSLEEIDSIFKESNSIFDTVKVAKEMQNSHQTLDIETPSPTLGSPKEGKLDSEMVEGES